MGLIRGNESHPHGYTAIAEMDGKNKEMLMDFGILRLGKGESYVDDASLEKAYLLVYGEVELRWEDKKQVVRRENCFDVPPTVLHVPRNVIVTISGMGEDVEIDIIRTDNENVFVSKLYMPEETPDERRGEGLMRETSTRIVRTVFDYSNAPYSNLVLGEVIGYPGKWSSYPPHHHPQPEIYYYKTNPPQGFGYGELGDEVLKVRNNDAVCIPPGMTHPHAAAPGYALWYLWAIRHLEGAPYITPTFLEEHLWVLEKEAPIWNG